MLNLEQSFTCHACGHVGPSDDFTTYYGSLGDNVGICRKCSDKGITVIVNSKNPIKDPPKITLEEFTKSIDEFNELLLEFITSESKCVARDISSKMTKRLMLIYRYVYENCKDDEGEKI